MKMKSQSGRSMVEMLGVMAVAGVLTVGGVYGYKQAMLKIQMNEFQEFLTLLHLSYLQLQNEGYELDTSGTNAAALNIRFDLCDMGFLGKNYCRDLGSDAANAYWPGAFTESRFFVAIIPYLRSSSVMTRVSIGGWRVDGKTKDYCYALFLNVKDVANNPNAAVRIGGYGDGLYYYAKNNFSGWQEGCDKLASGNTSQRMIYLDGFF